MTDADVQLVFHVALPSGGEACIEMPVTSGLADYEAVRAALEGMCSAAAKASAEERG